MERRQNSKMLLWLKININLTILTVTLCYLKKSVMLGSIDIAEIIATPYELNTKLNVIREFE